MIPQNLRYAVEQYIDEGRSFQDLTPEEQVLIVSYWAKSVGRDYYLDCIRDIDDSYFVALAQGSKQEADAIYNDYVVTAFEDQMDALWILLGATDGEGPVVTHDDIEPSATH